MEKKNCREYTREFKLQALELLKRGDKSAGQIERELGIPPGLPDNWRARCQIPENERLVPQNGPSDLETAEGWLYRAVILGLCSWRVTGWAMRDRLDKQLAESAWRMAVVTCGWFEFEQISRH